MSTMTKVDKIVEALADPSTLTWTEERNCGRQGDVLLRRLRGPALEAVSASNVARVKRLDQTLAKGSRAAHICYGDVTVWETPEKGVLLVEARNQWALVHTDVATDKHHAQILCPGWYRSEQQQEATPLGVVAD